MRISCTLSLTITLLSCMAQTTRYEYADGSANRYIITPSQFEYIPVTPEESSTGAYSGGEPKDIPLQPKQYEAIRALLDEALNTPSAHMNDRIKTSGLVVKIDGNKTTSCILTPKSAILLKIEELLKGIRQL
jgi:hypothetical protein